MNDPEDTARRGASQPLISRRDALRAVAGCSVVGFAAPGAVLASADPSHPDAELLRLGDELDAACTAERAAWHLVDLSGGNSLLDARAEMALDAVRSIVRRIETCAASSIDGLFVKARAIAWCHCGEPLSDKAFNEQATTDVRIAVTVVNDLLAMQVAA